MKLFKMGKNVKIKILMLHMMDEMVKTGVDEFLFFMQLFLCNIVFRGLEFSSYEMELRNRVTQNDVTL